MDGMGFYILFGAVAVFFLVKKFGLPRPGLPGIFRTLGYPPSRFRRTDRDGGTVFSVTPARASWAARSSPWPRCCVVQSAHVLRHERSECGVHGHARPDSACHGPDRFSGGRPPPQASTIAVSDDTLQRGSDSWALSDIRAFGVHRGSQVNTEQPAQTYTGASTSLMFSRALDRKAVERSCRVTVRTRAGSKETVLAGGLTRDCPPA